MHTTGSLVSSLRAVKKRVGSSLSFLHSAALCQWSRQSAAAACDKAAPLSRDLINGHTLYLHHAHTRGDYQRHMGDVLKRAASFYLCPSLSLSLSVSAQSRPVNQFDRCLSKWVLRKSNKKTEFLSTVLLPMWSSNEDKAFGGYNCTSTTFWRVGGVFLFSF